MNDKQIKYIIEKIESCDGDKDLVDFFLELSKKLKLTDLANTRSNKLLNDVIKKVIKNERRLDKQQITERETSNPKERILAELNNINKESPIPSDDDIEERLFNEAMNRMSDVAAAAPAVAAAAPTRGATPAAAPADDGGGASGGGAAAAATGGRASTSMKPSKALASLMASRAPAPAGAAAKAETAESPIPKQYRMMLKMGILGILSSVKILALAF